ncbi:MAG: UDP-N-acetylmuramate dehydrogenase [Holophagaceae bacterium]|nr:UDP-N-acetylmuramate dehydrogenase [Holophagaceae bacterium]
MELPAELLSIPHRQNVPFSQLTTLGMGGICRWLIEPETENDVQCFIKVCRTNSLEYKVLGGGSNLLVLSDVKVPVLRLNLPKKLHVTGKDVFASASCRHLSLSRDVAEMGLSGLEWASGIPGSFGGAIRMNAGANGCDWGKVLNTVRFVTSDGELVEKKVECEDFTYRSSFLCEGGVAISATFALHKGEREAIISTMEAFQAKRKKHQPSGRSAGCIFRNPPSKSAGQLIESAGLKGLRVGSAVVSDVHANFLLNTGEATSRDFWELIQIVKSKVYDVHSCKLELEVEVWE